MEVKIVRLTDDGGARFWLTLTLPGGRRAQREDSARSAAAGAQHRRGRVLKSIGPDDGNHRDRN
jgi:hypothetical protein